MKVESLPRRRVHLDDIKVGVAMPNARHEFTGIRDLAENIAVNGLFNNPIVWEKEDVDTHTLVLIAGERRYKALNLLRTEGRLSDLTVEVAVFNGNYVDADIVGFLDNTQRQDLTSYEKAFKLADFQKYNLSNKEISEKTGMTVSQVTNYLTAYNNAKGELKKAWKSNKIPFKNVYDIAKLDEKKQEAMVKQVLAMREGGTKKSRGAASRAAAKASGGATRATGKDINLLRKQLSKKENLSDYLKGVLHGLEYDLGERGTMDFDETF